MRAQQFAGDNVTLNLTGAIPDALDAGVAPQHLQRQLISLSTKKAVMRLRAPLGVSSTPVTANKMAKSGRAGSQPPGEVDRR